MAIKRKKLFRCGIIVYNSFKSIFPWRGTWKEEGGGVLVNQAPHQIDLLQWFMGPVDELFGYWSNLNHPYIEVEDTAIAVIKFKNGGIGNIIVSNSVNRALYGKIHLHRDNSASIGVQTDGEEGRKAVEIFTAIYRSNRDKMSVKFPLKAEYGDDFDGRLVKF